MKEHWRGVTLLMAFIVLIAGSMGCATMYVSSLISSHNNPVLTDEIVAIGRPDASLAEKMGQKNAIAFLGMKNTYMLFKGGEELEQIAQGGLDESRITMSPTNLRSLYLKDQKIWGYGRLVYNGTGEVSVQEQEKLAKLGFSSSQQPKWYERTVYIEGVVYPAIKLSDKQSLLKDRIPFELYNSPDAKPPTNYAAVVVLPLAVAVDVVLSPVYLLGLVVLVITTASGHL
jgi:hypothetical protein